MMNALLYDLRIAARGLRRSPGFTVVAAVTLALGIGATTAVFSVVYGVLFRPLPFPSADRLVQIIQLVEQPEASPPRAPSRSGLTHNQFANIERGTTTLAAIGRYSSTSATLTGRGDPVRLMGAAIAPRFFAELGVAPLHGRMLASEDATPGADPVVVLSYAMWRRYFNQNLAVLESRIVLGDVRRRVVGIMPAGFGFPSLASQLMTRNSAGELADAPEYWVAIPPVVPTAPRSGGFSLFPAIAVVREGVRAEQAEAELRSLLLPLPNGRPSQLQLVNAREEMGRDVGRALFIFQAGVALVLLIACVNVVNLMLARSAYRRSELAVRSALGASRGRLVREGVAEALLLSAGGGALGCALAFGVVAGIRTLPPTVLPRLQEIQVDSVVLGFAAAASALSGLLVGLFSAIRIARGAPWSGARLVTAMATPRTRPSSVLVVVELAAAMVLVTAAGLLTGSFANLMSHDTGYNPDGVATFRVTLPEGRYPTPAAQRQVSEGLSARLRSLPYVESAGATSGYLTSNGIAFWDVLVDGRPGGRADFRFASVTPGYFETLQVPLLRGRTLTEADVQSSAPVIVVNESFARAYLGDGDPIGRRLTFLETTQPTREVVGVVGDTTHGPDDGRFRAGAYFPPDGSVQSLAQLIMIVRTEAGLGRLLSEARAALRAFDPQLAIYDATMVDEILQRSSSSPRFYTGVAVFCGVVAFALSALGLYGLLAYLVGMRTREFGIRMALGADSHAILKGVMGHGLRLALAGTALGAVGSFLTVQSLESLLFGVAPRDGTTFALAAAILFSAAAAASYVPSRRATRVDPVVALRAE
jgi:predicted permease